MLIDPHIAASAGELKDALEEVKVKVSPLGVDERFPKAAKDKITFDPVQQYLADVKTYRLLTREEEKDLAFRIQNNGDEDAVNQLVKANLRLVIKIARRYQNEWNCYLLDLIQEGNIGLIKAAWRYDPSRNVKFSHYASYMIKAYILKYIQNNWRMVKVTTSGKYRQLFYWLGREESELRGRGIEPTPELLSERFDVGQKDIMEMNQRMKKQDFSLDIPIQENSDTKWLDLIQCNCGNAEQKFMEMEMQQLIREKIVGFKKTISKREKMILDQRIYTDSPLTLQSIGHRMGLSRERIRQMEKEILERLKKYLTRELKD